jgi:hypothetical protein
MSVEMKGTALYSAAIIDVHCKSEALISVGHLKMLSAAEIYLVKM